MRIIDTSNAVKNDTVSVLKVCVLQNNDEVAEPIDLAQFLRKDAKIIAEHNLPQLDIESVICSRDDTEAFLNKLVARGFDVFINLCDSPSELPFPGIEVVKLLDKSNLPYTGADEAFFEPPKHLMKSTAEDLDVDTPKYLFAYNTVDVELAAASLRYPVIVKHYNGYGSVGMSPKSRCTCAQELRAEAARMLEMFHGVLIEEFIDGIECTVLVVETEGEPIALQPVQCSFPPGETFKHEKLKWVDWQGLSWQPVTDTVLDAKLRAAAKTMFKGLGGTSYGRCDFRVDKEGNPMFLEINPQCGILYPLDTPGSADTILLLDPLMPHGLFIHHIIRVAMSKKTKIAYKN